MSGIHSSIPQSVLDQYYAEEKIGEGTYGIVYKAWDVERKKYIALKKIRVESLVSFRFRLFYFIKFLTSQLHYKLVTFQTFRRNSIYSPERNILT